jgi:hypothetical protein
MTHPYIGLNGDLMVAGILAHRRRGLKTATVAGAGSLNGRNHYHNSDLFQH